MTAMVLEEGGLVGPQESGVVYALVGAGQQAGVASVRGGKTPIIATCNFGRLTLCPLSVTFLPQPAFV